MSSSHIWSLFHALIVVFTSFLCYTLESYYIYSISISFVYILLDLIIHTSEIDKATGVHHFLFLAFTSYAIFIDNSFASIIYKYIGIFEVSTIFLNLYHMYKKEIYGLLFVASFFISRIVIGAYITFSDAYYFISQHTIMSYINSILGIALYILQVYWFWKIVMKLKRRMSK